MKESQILKEPQILKEHQISKETQITIEHDPKYKRNTYFIRSPNF